LSDKKIIVQTEIQETNISQDSWVEIVNSRWSAYHNSMIRFGEMSLRGVFLLNGISSISLLSFFGIFIDNLTISTIEVIEKFSNSLEYFAFGSLLAVLGVIAAYFGEGTMWVQFDESRPLYKIDEEQYKEAVKTISGLEIFSNFTVITTILSALISIMLFIFGVFAFTDAIESYKYLLVN